MRQRVLKGLRKDLGQTQSHGPQRTGSPQRTHLHTARTARGTLALDYLKDVTLTDTELVWRWDRKKITQRLVPTRRLPVAH